MKISYLLVAVLAASFALAMAGDDVAWCQSKTTCGDCVKGLSCLWCPEEGVNKQGACYHGKPWGAIDGNQGISKCASYRYLQCKIPGLALMILICVGAGLVLLTLILCICCCCCCRKKRQSSTSYALLPSDAASQEPFLSQSVNTTGGSSAYSAHPVTDQRRRELNEKYNKYRTPAESYY